jgi:hypothetical protein
MLHWLVSMKRIINLRLQLSRPERSLKDVQNAYSLKIELFRSSPSMRKTNNDSIQVGLFDFSCERSNYFPVG